MLFTCVQCHLVMDVGAVYDHKARRYDHHQREFKDVMSELDCKTKVGQVIISRYSYMP